MITRNAVIISIIVLFFSCKRNDPTVTRIDNNLLSSFDCKAGSYWIYKDSLTGDIDSFFVRTRVASQYASNHNSGTDEIQLSISEYPTFPVSRIDTHHWDEYFIANMFVLFYQDDKIGMQNIKFVPLIYYPFTTDWNRYGQPESQISSSYYDTPTVKLYNKVNINGNSFDNVAEVNHKHYTPDSLNEPLLTTFSYNDTFYVAENIGMIKMILNHPNDPLKRKWELQRWSIIK